MPLNIQVTEPASTLLEVCSDRVTVRTVSTTLLRRINPAYLSCVIININQSSRYLTKVTRILVDARHLLFSSLELLPSG